MQGRCIARFMTSPVIRRFSRAAERLRLCITEDDAKLANRECIEEQTAALDAAIRDALVRIQSQLAYIVEFSAHRGYLVIPSAKARLYVLSGPRHSKQYSSKWRTSNYPAGSGAAVLRDRRCKPWRPAHPRDYRDIQLAGLLATLPFQPRQVRE